MNSVLHVVQPGVHDTDKTSVEVVSFDVDVHGGFEGATRVTSMLRGRSYDVRRLSIDASNAGGRAHIVGTVSVARGARSLLESRLQRLPAVVEVRVVVGHCHEQARVDD